MVRATRLSSPQQLYALLGSRPAALYLADDYGTRCALPAGNRLVSSNRRSLITGTVASGADLLLDNWQELGLRHQDGDGSSYPTIHSPVLSMLGTIAGVQCGKVFGAQEVSRGSIDSFLFVPATDIDHWRARRDHRSGRSRRTRLSSGCALRGSHSGGDHADTATDVRGERLVAANAHHRAVHRRRAAG